MFGPVATIDGILQAYRPQLGKDFATYNNHVYRVYYLAVPFVGGSDSLTLLAVAAAFHDIGIWTHGTFDYLGPSAILARQYAATAGFTEDETVLIVKLIDEHHKITAASNGLSNAFRLADWYDLTFGLVSKPQDKQRVKALSKQYPTLGFHRFLVKLFLQRLVRHPLSPLPMFRW